MSDETTCPLCSSTLKNPSRYSQHGDAEYFDCPRCGTYLLDGYTKHDSRLGKNKHLVSAWIRRQHKLGTEIPIGHGIDAVVLNIPEPQRRGRHLPVQRKR